MIAFNCPSCARPMRVKAELAGRKVKCPSCGQPATAPVEEPTLLPSMPGSGSREAPREQTVGGGKDAWEDHPAELTDFLAPPQAGDEIGRLGGFRVLEVLGFGGMGVVYQAEDPRLGRKVAIKAMLPHLADSKSSQQRFLREARAAAALEHDHIVPILQVGEDRGAPFIVMPFLKGEPLDKVLDRDGKLPLAEVLRIGREIARGLAAAHAAGLIHRDIKPANIWLEAPQRRVKILDFGLALAAADDARLTQTGALIGTPAYMAPEQATGGTVDARADLFSLGCVLYRMATGRPPFKGKDPISTLLSVASDQPPELRLVNADVPADLSRLVLQLLAKDPQQRPQSAQAVVQALQEIKHHPVAPTARPVPGGEKEQGDGDTWTEIVRTPVLRSPRKRPPVPWLVAGGVLALGILMAAILLLWPKSGSRETSKKDDARAGSGANQTAPRVKDTGQKSKNTPVKAVDQKATARATAEWVLSVPGKVVIRVGDRDQEVTAVKDLPAGDFQLIGAAFWNAPQLTDDDLVRFQLPSLTWLNVSYAPINDAGLAHLKGLSNLTSLELKRLGMTDAGLESFKDLTGLTHLGLTEMGGIKGPGLVHVKGLNKLTSLDLAACWPLSTGLENLPKGLTYLRLAGTQVTDAELAHLEELTRLTELDMADCRNVTGTAFDHLPKGLTKLRLDNTQVGDAGLAHLKGMTKLQSLDLAGTPVGDAGLEHLKGLTVLTGIGLNRTRVGDAGLAQFKGMKSLRSLSLVSTRVTDAGLKSLAGLPLEGIDLTDSRVTVRGIARLRADCPRAQIQGQPRASLAEDLLAEGATLRIRLAEGKEDLLVKTIADLPHEPFRVRAAVCTGVKKPLSDLLARLNDVREYEFDALEAIDLSGCTIFQLQPWPFLRHLRRLTLDRTPVNDLSPLANLADLEELSLAGTPIGDGYLPILARLSSLRKLDLARTAISGQGLGRLGALPKLTELSLAGLKLSAPGAAELGTLTRLERLSLAGCTLSDTGLELLNELTSLTHLDLTGTQVSAAGVAALQKALRKCQIVAGGQK